MHALIVLTHLCMCCVCDQIANVGDEEALVCQEFIGYDASKHCRPADFHEGLENLYDLDLEPIIHPRNRYVQWRKGSRPRAEAVPFSFNSMASSFDLGYGAMLGMEFDDGSKFVRCAGGHTYRLLDLIEMREAQPFQPDSRLAVELLKTNHSRSIMVQPDTVVLDMRSQSSLSSGNCRPIVVLTPENLLLASKMFPLLSIFLIEDVMDAGADDVSVSFARITMLNVA